MLRIVLIIAIGSIISGLVAFLGNKLGRQVGRRKMSILGLRPRYTSNVITVATGSLIFLITLGLAAAWSSDVRTFLTGLDALRAQRKALVEEIQTLNETRRMGPVFNTGDPLAIGVINCGLSQQDTREQVDTLLGLANRNAVARNNRKAEEFGKTSLDEDTRLVGYIPQEREEIIQRLSEQSKGTTVLCEVVAGGQPSYFKDRVVAQFALAPNPRVFRRGELIAAARINGAAPSEQVLAEVQAFILKDVQFAGLARGMMRNPLTGRLDTSLDLGFAAPANRLLEQLADRIARTNKAVVVRVMAKRDIYPLGPMDTRLVVSPQ